MDGLSKKKLADALMVRCLIKSFFLALTVSYAGCEQAELSDVTNSKIVSRSANTTNEEAHVHVGWKINLVVLAALFLSAGIILLITWHFRDSIRIHNRIPRKLLHFKMTDQRFSFNHIRQRFSLALSPRIGPSKSRAGTPSQSPSGTSQAQETRNMGFMRQYTNGTKRDSWDVSRDSITGGPRCSWYHDADLGGYKLQTAQEPRLSTIHGSEMAMEDAEDHHSDEYDLGHRELRILDAYDSVKTEEYN